MAIKLYNPKTKTFVTYTPSDGVDLPFADLLQLNILIELHTHTHYLSNLQVDNAYEEPQNIRADIVAVT